MSDPSPSARDSERTKRHTYFNHRINAFIERYAPRSYEGRDFEIDLRNIIMTAAELAQEPFAYELHHYRENAAIAAMLRPLV